MTLFPQKPGRFHLLLTPFLVALNLRFIAVPPPTSLRVLRYSSGHRKGRLKILSVKNSKQIVGNYTDAQEFLAPIDNGMGALTWLDKT